MDELGEIGADAWWNCRNFVLNDDLAMDYDIGGLAVSLSFFINITTFAIMITQLWEYVNI